MGLNKVIKFKLHVGQIKKYNTGLSVAYSYGLFLVIQAGADTCS